MNEPLWEEKYRPRTIDDCVLPSAIRTQFEGYREKRLVPNLILSGRAGIVKTSSIRALLDELDLDSYLVPASTHGTIDTLRTEVTQFAATISFTGGRKYVILDEADGMSRQMQEGLRNVISEYIDNCGFILTCNYINKLIEPLRSRTGVIEFRVPPDEKPRIQAKFFKRMKFILDREGVPFEPEALAGVVQKHSPDWRRIVNELQRYASGAGRIDAGAMVSVTDEAVKAVIELIREKKFPEMRAWVAENGDIDPVDLFTRVYDLAYELFDPKSVPMVVHTINEFQKSHAVVANPEINVAAFFTVLMADAQFKN
jgi:DNA polymerase III delta prime subunit